MNLPYPFDKASGVQASLDGTIRLIDHQGKALVLIPMTTAFELSPEVKGSGYGSGYGGGYSSGEGGYGDGSGFSDGYGSGHCYGHCYGDGSGHGAFQLTHDIIAALTLCSKHTDSATKDTCMQGVYMQIVRSDHDLNYPPVINPSELESKWFDLCESLTKENLNKDFAYNCKIILSKLLAHRMIGVTTNWNKDGGKDNQKIVTYLEKATSNAVNQCKKFSQGINDACQKDLAYMGIYISQMQEDLKKIYCENLPKSLLSECLSAKPISD